MKNIPSLLLILTAGALAGCVSTGTFKAKQAEADAQKARADAAEKKVADLIKQLDAAKKTSDDLTTQLKTSGDTLAGLQVNLKTESAQLEDMTKSNKDLKDSLDANKSQLSKKVADLIKQRDEIDSKLVAARTQIDTLTGQLSAAQAAATEIEKSKAAELAAVKKSYEQMTAGLNAEIANGQVQITQLKGKLTVNMVDQILFDSGMAEIKAQGKMVLDKVGVALNGIADKDIRIEGHTDNKPITAALQGKYATNWELSTARATAVARYLQDHAKVDPARLVATGYGEYRPKASNDIPESRAQNRRIEIVLVPRD